MNIGTMAEPFRHGTTGRLVSIDVLRGCAILGVLVSHCFPHEPALDYLRAQAPWLVPLGLLISRGTQGVPLFFVISGFCIHLRWARETAMGRPPRVDAWTFWARRVHRLYPPYAVVLLLCFVMVVLAYAAGRAHYYPEPKLAIILTDFAAHALMLHGLHPFFDVGGGNPPMWSLAREEYLYALYFLLLLWRRRFGPLGATATVFAVGLATWWIVVPMVPAWYAPVVQSSALTLWIQWTLGAVAAEAFVGLRPLPAWCRSLWLSLACFLAGEVADRIAPPLGPVLYGVSFFILVNAAVAAEPRLARRRLALAVAAVGVFSYSLYLIHYPANMVLRETFRFVAAPPTVAIAFLAMAFKIVVSLACAALFFLAVERRFLHRPRRADVPHVDALAPASLAQP